MYHTKNLLFIDNGLTYDELCRILDNEYNIKIVKNMTAAKDILNHSESDIHALLIYTDLQEDIEMAIEFLKDSRSLISMPVLIYTDKENFEGGFEYLGSGVIDCVSKPFISKVIKNRLSNAIAFTDSMTFYGFAPGMHIVPHGRG